VLSVLRFFVPASSFKKSYLEYLYKDDRDADMHVSCKGSPLARLRSAYDVLFFTLDSAYDLVLTGHCTVTKPKVCVTTVDILLTA